MWLLRVCSSGTLIDNTTGDVRQLYRVGTCKRIGERERERERERKRKREREREREKERK